MKKGNRKSMPQAGPSMALSTMMEAANLVVGNILSVSPDMLVSNPQVRKDFAGIEELADSLKVEGQQSAIIVSPADPATGKYTIQKGERRWRAAKEAGLKKVNITVAQQPKSLSESITGQLVENIQRLDLKPMELATALGQLHAEGLSYSEIGKRLGKSKRWVQMYMNLELAPAYVQALCVLDVTQDMEVISILRTLSEIDEDECRDFCNKAGKDGGATRQEARAKLEQVKARNASEPDTGEASQTADTPAHAQTGTDADSKASNDGAAQFDVNPETGEAQAVMQLPEAVAAPSPKEEHDQAREAHPAAPAAAPASKPLKAEGLNATDKDAPEDWIDLSTADAMKVEVAVVVDGEQLSGYLMTDRVCPAPSFAWVYLYDDGYSFCTHVTNIAITGIKQQ